MSAKEIRKSFFSGGSISEVLKGVNIDIFDGELLCLQGESGCGKSTFLNIVGGLLNADSGSLTFMGNEITEMSEKELTEYRRDYIGFVFQSYNLMPNLTAKQNLDLIAELVKEPMDTDEALELVGMREKAGSYPSQLSGGQQQRISIARALVKKPKLIFADEPTAALDYKTSIEILTVFERIKETGTTILMVTHNEEITHMADRVIRFRDGRTYEVIVNHKPAKAYELKW
ncbi:MAG: ABC transporter ATP-binding protein [Clostridiales bacterium]|nr:ABC transporter ATP-binding protein [Candidatus Cacconaster stercorequi]